MAGKTEMISAGQALPGTEQAIAITDDHVVFGRSLLPPWPENMAEAVFAMGCFWGVERLFWKQDGIYLTMVGYSGGYTTNPSYEQVCTGKTGHTEAVRVIFDPAIISYQQLLTLFWEQHDPTQGMRQGNDIGTQYRSAIFATSPAQKQQAKESLEAFQNSLTRSGLGQITTEIESLDRFYYAENYHQQYLARNPNGYCGLKGTGVSCPI